MKNFALILLPLTLHAALPAGAVAPPYDVLTPGVSGLVSGNVLVQSVQHAQADKEGRVLVTGFTVADARAEKGVTLSAPQAAYSEEAIMADPSLRDRVEVVLTPELVAHLKDLGIDDPLVHFKGRTLQVRGTRQETIYTGFPAFVVCTITVDRLEDIKVTGKAADKAAKPEAGALTR